MITKSKINIAISKQNYGHSPVTSLVVSSVKLPKLLTDVRAVEMSFFVVVVAVLSDSTLARTTTLPERSSMTTTFTTALTFSRSAVRSWYEREREIEF